MIQYFFFFLHKTKEKKNSKYAALFKPVLTGCGRLPLEALLLLPLLSDLRELPLIVLPCPALFGLSPGVVLHPLHLFLPRFHQLVVALTDLLLLQHMVDILLFAKVSTKLNGPWQRFCQKNHHCATSCCKLVGRNAFEDCRW